MQGPKWYVIGQNQYRLALSPIRSLRPYFPFLAVALAALYLLYVAPWIVGYFVDEALAFLLSQAAIATIQILLLIIFVWFFFFPVSLALREPQASELEAFLSAPVKASHLLLGEFLGVMPFYGIGIILIAGVFTSILDPVGVSVLQKLCIVLVFALTFFSSLWMGTVVAGILRTRLGRSERGKDIGKALGFVIALPVVGLMYALMGGSMAGTMSGISEGGVLTGILNILPSSWGADVIIGFASEPGAITGEALARLGGLIAFFLASLWIGVGLAQRAYSIEAGSMGSHTASPDGPFYRWMRSLGRGGAFGTILATTLKDYIRRAQNLSRVGYIVGLIFLINVFLIRPEKGAPPFFTLLMSQGLFGLLAAFVLGEVTVRGKEGLFIYRKAPAGEGKLIRARLIHGAMVTLPIALAITIAQLALLPGNSASIILLYSAWISVVVLGYVLLSLGLFLLMPAFSERSGEFMATSMFVAMFGVMGFIAMLVVLGETLTMWIFPAAVWGLGLVVLLLGKANFSRIE